jgi:2-hydroxymuconate-semialdehyde hydrolase
MSAIETTAYAERDVAVGPYTMHVAESGDPSLQPVIWLHGSGPGVTSLSNWEGVITALPGYYHICPDMLGFGASSHPDPPPLGLADWSDLRGETIVALLDVLGVQRAHFVGNSMGGMITLNVVKRWPERVDKMVLMGSGGAPLPPGPALAGMMSFYHEPSTARLLAMLTEFVYDKDALADRLQRVAEARLPLSLREDVKRSHLATFSHEGRRAPVITEAELGAIANRTLLVHGREDQMLPVAGSSWLAERIPNAQLHVFGKTGHWTQIEQADAFRFLVDAFFHDRI